MLRYVVRRLLWVVVLLFAISVLTFLLFYLVPGDPAKQALGKGVTPATLAQVRHRMGLDLPTWKQYLNFVRGPGHATGVLRWPPQPRLLLPRPTAVLQTILDRVPVTALLALGGCVLWLLLGVSAGILAALRPRSLYDRGAMVQGVVLFAAFFVITANLLVDLAYAALDPRVPLRLKAERPLMCSASAVPIQPGRRMNANCRSAGLSRTDRP